MAEVLDHPQRNRAQPTAQANDSYWVIRDPMGEVEATVMRLEGLAFCQRELIRHNVDTTFHSPDYRGLYKDFEGLLHLAQTIEGVIGDLIEQIEQVYAATGSAPPAPTAS